jgi:hypothetical protein
MKTIGLIVLCIGSCANARFANTEAVGVRHAASSSQYGNAQQPSGAQQAPTSPQAKTADVDTLDHILSAVYDSISGPAGPRDWDRFRALFDPGARLIPTRREVSGKITARMLTVEDYVQGAQSYFEKEGFFETPVANHIEQWDRLAHVWSTYESRHAKGEKPFARGINSFQFLFDGARWWVISIYWEGEDSAHRLPDKYLK